MNNTTTLSTGATNAFNIDIINEISVGFFPTVVAYLNIVYTLCSAKKQACSLDILNKRSVFNRNDC
jgi:hypothetical protein